MSFEDRARSFAAQHHPRDGRPWAAGSFNVLLLLATVLMTLLHGGDPCVRTAGAAEKGLPAAGRVLDFSWVPTVQGRAVEHIVAGKEAAVPVDILVEGEITEVSFRIPQRFRAYGIRLDRSASEVKGGKAHVTVLFNIPQGMPLGRHNLPIHILDRRTGTEIGSGTLPFIFLPSAAECHC